MSVQPIIQALEKLIKLHENLMDTAVEKTGLIKQGSLDKLQSLLVKEHKFVQVLEQAELKRQQAVEEWLLEQGRALREPTITAILEMLSNEREQKELEKTAVKLADIVTRLKQQEQLNQALLHQSMQYVELSMDAIKPSLKHMNYGNQQTSFSPERSVFDSKA
ncbi:FlgN protein [Lentibacillus persicus]|uniref:FlgN protein n=1 Tax=Lentibacillus persicus TaxID=640948 RepID=A0A1I1WPC8_9BACI|nr:flagellar protein FlgN [Lentibacillus persicus]SFD96922.1 FlgN protein [Lentibacillus persicus]